MDPEALLERVRGLSARFASERSARQLRRALDRADFDRLADAGFLLSGVPVEHDGIWESPQRSTRLVSELLRTLARGDPSVALVCSMPPGVLGLWMATPKVAPSFQEAWDEQRRWVFQTAREGAWWGTITSEPGTGGDVTRTQMIARPDPSAAEYRVTGQKHFGSGIGVMSYMLTTAIPEGEGEPDWFFLNAHGVPWDGSAGIRLLSEWDGHGMIATQSHAMMFEDFPATRVACPGNFRTLIEGVGGMAACYFTAVILGIVEASVEAARRELGRRRESMRAYERVEWSRAETEAWVIAQAYEGMLRAMEQAGGTPREVVQGKTAVAELAESAMARICRVIGGGTYSRCSPFGFWFEDVRALGFLRPPWGLSYDAVFETSWSPPGD